MSKVITTALILTLLLCVFSESSLQELSQGSARGVLGRLEQMERLRPPVGTILPYAGAWDTREAIPGWLLCDGQQLPAGDFDALKQVLGRDAVPDLQGRTLIGAHNTYDERRHPKSLTVRKLNTVCGTESQSLTLDQLPKHAHSVADAGHTHQLPYDRGDQGDSANVVQYWKGSRTTWELGTSKSSPSNISIDSAGEGKAVSVMQPSFTVNYIIRAR